MSDKPWRGANFADDIEEAADGEPIEAIVILTGDEWDYQWRGDDDRAIPLDMWDKPLTWDVARPLLDHEYDDGYGGQDCPDIHAWTATKVLFIHEYDGSTYVRTVPRNPPTGTA